MAENSLKKTSKEKRSTRKEKKASQGRKKRKLFGIRKFPILLRILLVLILLVIALILGVMVGYSVLGDGSATDALDKETWQHIIDIVNKKE